MISDPTTAWLISIAFLATAAWCSFRAWTSTGTNDVVGNLAHVAMSLVMAAMPWAWVDRIPTAPQVVVFGAAAIWYVWLALVSPRAHGGPDGAAHGRLTLGYHAVMMGAMVAMALIMSSSMGSMTMSAGAPMKGMDMGNMSSMSMDYSPFASGVSIVLGVFFLCAAALYVVRLLRIQGDTSTTAPTETLVDLVSVVIMALGMGLLFVIPLL
jgi:hypothetical protein